MDNKEKTADKLDILFDMQGQLNDYITKTRNISYTKEQWLEKRSLALIEETMEMLNEINYKWWKKQRETDSAALKEEIVDMLHFFVGICIDAGLSADELFEIYKKKNLENYNRQKGLSDKSGYEA